MTNKSKSILVYGILILLTLAVAVPAAWHYIKGAPLTGTSAGRSSDKGIAGYENDKPIVGIAHKDGATYDNDTEDLVREAIKKAGGLKSLIKKDCTVVIKPNIVFADKPGTTVTHWKLVQTVVDIVRELGAGEVYIAEASPMGNNFAAAGYNNIKNAKLFDMNVLTENDCYKIEPEKGLTGEALWVPKMYKDADVLITMPKMKTHSEAQVTLSLKNAIGVPPKDLYWKNGAKGRLHELKIYRSIVDLNLIRKPDFTVIDAITAGEGDGPANKRFVKAGMVIASHEIVAADTVAAYYMGFDPLEVLHIRYAGEVGLGINDLDGIVVKGVDIEAIRKKFVRGNPAYVEKE